MFSAPRQNGNKKRYLHRIGRSGRFGHLGLGINLVHCRCLLLHVRQTHTHLPPSLRKEERAGRLRKEGGAQFLNLIEGGKRGATEPKKGLLASFQGKSSAKGPSLEA